MENRKNWGWRKDTAWYKATTAEISKNKYPCPKCGRKRLIPYNMDTAICDWCGTAVYKDKKTEFKTKMRQMLRQTNRE